MQGVIGLRDFLEYAEKGKSINTLSSSNKQVFLSYQAEIAEALKEKGFKVSENIGASDYKIDLAIAHAEDNNKFIL